MTIKEFNKETLGKILEENVDVSNEAEMINFLNSLTKEKAEELGFRKWSDEKNLYLIPGVFYDFLPKGLKVESIMGEKKTVGTDYVDDDTRFGLLAYGIEIKGKKDE